MHLYENNMNLHENNMQIRKLINTFGNILHLFSTFDKVFLVDFTDYFIRNNLDFFIDIFNNKKELRVSVKDVISKLLNKIIALNNPIRKNLLSRFKKWFVLIIQRYVIYREDHFGYIEEEFPFDSEDRWGSDDAWELENWEYRRHIDFPDWYFTEEVLQNIFFETLPWLNIHQNGLAFLSSYISKGQDFVISNTKKQN